MYAYFNFIGDLQVTKKQANKGYHRGQCEPDVKELRQVTAIKRQLNKIDPATLKKELKEYGCWESEELNDHESNLDRILWIACADIVEEIHK